MKFNDIIATTALSTGLVKMYMDLENSGNVDVKLKKSIIFGLFITVSWFIYYTNEYGFSHFTIYTLISIILQLHILRNITIKEKSS
jgi:hypothetical protein|tara:strand:+ start:2168 stop:2425 length:258 start_codon:yes stop_codon:yes gene_type:complete